MKKLITFLLLFLAASQCDAQPTRKLVTIPVDSITLGGIKFRASASFECMIWNTREKTVALQWRLNVHGRDSSIVTSKAIEQVADNSTYVYQDGSPCNGDIVYDSTTMHYRCGGVPVLPEYDFYEIVAEKGAGGATINDLIRAACIRRKEIFKL